MYLTDVEFLLVRTHKLVLVRIAILSNCSSLFSQIWRNKIETMRHATRNNAFPELMIQPTSKMTHLQARLSHIEKYHTTRDEGDRQQVSVL